MTTTTAPTAGVGTGSACLRPGGRLTNARALTFRGTIRRHVGAGVRSLVLDLRAVSGIDAAGVAALVDAARVLDATGGELRIVANRLVARALKQTGTISAFRFCDPEHEV